MLVKFVNTTTKLPVGLSILNKYKKILHPQFEDLIKSTCNQSTLDIDFVCESDFNHLRDVEPDIDLLGAYFAHHHLAHRPKIFVCPELILNACLSLKDKVAAVAQISFGDFYELILIKVIIHELAHFVMDPYASKEHECPDRTQYVLTMIKEGRFEHGDPIPDHCCPAHFLHYSRFGFHYDVNSAIKFVEESLANSIALNQNYNLTEMSVVRVFIENQPPEYVAGLKWSMTFEKLLEIGDIWRSLKEQYLDSGLSWVRTSEVLPCIGLVAADLQASIPKIIKFNQALAKFQQPVDIPEQDISLFKAALINANDASSSEYEQLWALEKWAVVPKISENTVSLLCKRTRFPRVSDRSKELFGNKWEK